MGVQPRQSNQDSRSLLPLVYDGDEAWKNVPDESFSFSTNIITVIGLAKGLFVPRNINTVSIRVAMMSFMI